MPSSTTAGKRIELWIKPEDEALIARAAALENTDLTGAILRQVLPEGVPSSIVRSVSSSLSATVSSFSTCWKIHRSRLPD